MGDQANFIETQPKSSDPSLEEINNDRSFRGCIVYVCAWEYERARARACVCVLGRGTGLQAAGMNVYLWFNSKFLNLEIWKCARFRRLNYDILFIIYGKETISQGVGEKGGGQSGLTHTQTPFRLVMSMSSPGRVYHNIIGGSSNPLSGNSLDFPCLAQMKEVLLPLSHPTLFCCTGFTNFFCLTEPCRVIYASWPKSSTEYLHNLCKFFPRFPCLMG